MKKASRVLLLVILAALLAQSAACGRPADDAEATLPPGVFIPDAGTPAPTEPPAPAESPSREPTVPEGGGILRLQVNPDILVVYDAEGTVVDILAWNDDGADLLRDYPGFDGKSFRTVIGELVAVIGSAGYFDLPDDADAPVITIELCPGSTLPEGTTMEDLASDVNDVIDSNHWTVQVDTVDNSVPADATATDTAGTASETNAVPVRATGRPSGTAGGNSGGQAAATARPAAPTAPPVATAASTATPAPAPTSMPASSTNADIGSSAAEDASSSSIPSAPAATAAPAPADPAPDLGGYDGDVEDASAT